MCPLPREVRSESSASERCILSLEEHPLSLVVDTTGDDQGTYQLVQVGGTARKYLFFLEYPIPILDILFLHVRSHLGSFPPPLKLRLVLILYVLGSSLEALRYLPTRANHQHQEYLLSFVGIRVIHNDTTPESGSLCDRGYQLDLVVRGGIELEDGTRGVLEGGEEGCEETSETVGRGGCWVGGFGVQEPLDDGDTTAGVSFEMYWVWKRCGGTLLHRRSSQDGTRTPARYLEGRDPPQPLVPEQPLQRISLRRCVPPSAEGNKAHLAC